MEVEVVLEISLEICVVCKKLLQGLGKKLSWLEAVFCNLKIILFYLIKF